jgi:hypothetical protein
MASPIQALLDQWSDAFGNQLVRTTRNNADLASHYAFTPERLRFYRDGTREVIHYDLSQGRVVPGFEHRRPGEEDVFNLAPAANESLSLRSAERFRYTVNFVSQVTQAFGLSRPLEGDERLEIGLDTSRDRSRSDGYILEQTADMATDEMHGFARRNGNVLGEKQPWYLGVPTTTFQRPENSYNWYNVGKSVWRQTYTQLRNGIRKQINNDLGTITTQADTDNAGPGGRGPISGNGYIFARIEADADTSDLELYAGSKSFTTLGGIAASIKTKGAETPPLSVSQTTDWEPLGVAFRVAPDRQLVNTQIQSMELTQGEGEVMIIACDPSNVLDGNGDPLTDGDFTTTDRPSGRPVQHAGQNSVLQMTPPETVAQFPDHTGTPQTTATNPGGYQLAWDSVRTGGQGSKTTTRTADLEEKHGIFDGDYAVPIARPDTTDDMRFAFPTEMDE